MTVHKQEWADQFMRQARRWSWPYTFRRFSDKDLLVIDPDLRRAFEERYDSLKCNTVAPSRAAKAVEKGITRIFVLCREGEWALVKKLRAEFPRRKVYSCTYDLVPRSLFDRPKLAAREPVETKLARRPVVLVSTPYSDAEYLAEIMRLNNMAEPREYLDRTLATWLQEFKGFQVARFFQNVRRFNQQDGIFDLHVQTDVLAQIRKTSLANWEVIARWLKKNDAQVIYFSRRDKMAQTGFGAVLDGSIFRSVWDMRPVQRKAFNPKAAPFAKSNAWLQDLLIQEAELEDFLMESFPDFRSVTLEELVEQPAEVMKGLAGFLGEKAPKGFNVPDYRAPYLEMPNLWDDAVRFRHEMIDRLGLHVNAAGSLVTYTDGLLKQKG